MVVTVDSITYLPRAGSTSPSMGTQAVPSGAKNANTVSLKQRVTRYAREAADAKQDAIHPEKSIKQMGKRKAADPVVASDESESAGKKTKSA
jgi:hypothetical protein